MRKITSLVILMLFAAVLQADGSMYIDACTRPMTKERMKLLPVPADFKNYFFLQSFENRTIVVIGDFAASEAVICMIVDDGCNGSADRILEYYPAADKFTTVVKPTTRLFTGYPQICRDIIEGTVFKDPMRTQGGNEYTHEMASIPVLKKKITEGRFVSRRGHDGRYVRVTDADLRDTTMADFYFGIETGLYSLQFRTMYYKSGNVKIEPLLPYSVYCRDTNDPIVKEYVEMLLKQARDRKV